MKIVKTFFTLMILFQINQVMAWDGMSMPELQVEGRYLKDSYGRIVNLHGFAQTYSPWFNEENSQWGNYDVAACLAYNKNIIDGVLAAGWKANFLRLHMDPYWSNTPGVYVNGESDISSFDFNRFKKYLDNVFVPMAQYAISQGLYVVMRPPGVCPDSIAPGDEYNQYLIKVWGYVAQHPALKNNPNIMFELANEPINILGTDGTYGSGAQKYFDNLKTYFQSIVDVIRTNADNILWIPGLGYQSQYQGYARNPIEGINIGYAVHVYPGWFNSGNGYEPFLQGWNNQVQPVADFAPVMVTEMDWAPEKYKKSWGKDVTGTAGGEGFGANFKKITDDCGNVSWLIFTSPDLLDDFDGIPPATGEEYSFWNDPEACPWPVHQWYQDYAEEYNFEGVSEEYLTLSHLVMESGNNILVQTNSSVSVKLNAVFADGHIESVGSQAEYSVDDPSLAEVVNGRIFALKEGETNIKVAYTDKKIGKETFSVHVTCTTFPLTNGLFNPNIWEKGSFDETTHTLKTGLWGFGGWLYDGADLSGYKYLIAKLGSNNTADVDFKLFDGNSYWGASTSNKFGSNRQIIVRLKYAQKSDGTPLDPSHIYIAGFWSNGSNPFVIDTVFLSNSSEYDIPMIFTKDNWGNEISKIEWFNYCQNSGPSPSKSFFVSAEMLKNEVTIKSTTNFEISLSESDGYSSSVILNQQNSILSNTKVYVRLKEGLQRNSYTGSLSITSEGAQNVKVSLSGYVDFPVGTNNLNQSDIQVISTEYYSITGQKIQCIENSHGVFIQRQFLSNGRVKATKVIRK